MRVSIVTPSYNQARYLEQTICSVLNSTPGPFEYFVIDGNSSDSSVEIIKKHEAHLTNWVSEKDNGQAEAINKGLSQAHGEIIAWINSDDYYLPGALQHAIHAFEQNPDTGLVYGNVLSVDAAGNSFNLQTFKPFNIVDLMSFQIISQPAVFMRRSVLEQAGLLDPGYHFLLDHHLWLRMAILAPIVFIPETLAAARYHAEAKNLARTADFGREAFKIIEWMKITPGFAPIFEQNNARIMSGAHRLNAFYLLDGGQYKAALSAYWQSFKARPATALRDWHRMIYACLALLGLKNIRGGYIRLRQWLNKNG
jgi:glycosyltransferase involved in cell wall biosynthesis